MGDMRKLCRQNPPIQNSHVLPRFAYKRYVANQAKGGSFVNLGTMTQNSIQLRRAWFCTSCEGLFAETYAARLLAQLDKNREGCNYGGELLQFAVSLSLRSCILELIEGNRTYSEDAALRAAREVWRKFLLGKTSTIGPFTQHACVIGDVDSLWAKCMGSQMEYVHGMRVTQIGPLIIFGLLKDKSQADKEERETLRRSELKCSGAILQTIDPGKQNGALTDSMACILNSVAKGCIDRASEFEPQDNAANCRSA